MRIKSFRRFGLGEGEGECFPLFETQTFRFEENKERIFRWVDHIKQRNKWWFPTPTYAIITNRSARVGDAERAGFTKEQVAKWKAQLTSPPFVSNGVWSQWDINRSLPRHTGKDRTLNYYVTLEKTHANLMRFFNSIPMLHNKLKAISDRHKTPISFKTHALVDVIVNDNDSLKVYYYDPAVGDEVERAVEEWSSDTGVKISDRTHKRGVDYRSNPNADKASWGQILADHIDREFEKLVLKYGGSVTYEQYYEWYKKALLHVLSTSNMKTK